MSCRHPDVRKFDGVRCCLACGEAVFEPAPPTQYNTRFGLDYQYRNLNYVLGQEIRLIILFPGEHLEPIRCNIIHVNLEDDPEFEAVSYTWADEDGDTSLSKIVRTVDGSLIKVTVNCHESLCQLRKPGLPRRVWLDAICINQRNTDERNHQVGLMSQIYSRAWRVMICIGDFDTYQPGHHRKYRDYSRLFHWLQQDDTERASTKEPHNSTLEHLVSLRYFQRVWVIQEVALAKSAYLHINDSELLLSAEILKRIRDCYKTSGVLNWDTRQGPEADIITCLRVGMDCDCSDPRDRIYAVLSLMRPETRSQIPVDYSLAVETVLTYAIIAIVTEHQNLEILRYVLLEDGFRIPQFKAFVESTVSPGVSKSGTIARFKGASNGPWRAETEVQAVSSLRNILSLCVSGPVRSRPADTTTSSVAPQLPTKALVPRGILPQLQVRAHFMNSIVPFPSCSCHHAQTLWAGQGSYSSDEMPWHCLERFCRYLDFCSFGSVNSYIQYSRRFQVSTWRPNLGCTSLDFMTGIELLEIPEELAVQRVDDQENISQIEATLDTLLQYAKTHSIWTSWENHQGPGEFFLTCQGVGFARRGFAPKDAIFAIDGVRTPLILREIGPQRYRIVGECSLWASHKSKSVQQATGEDARSTDPCELGYDDTRIIEIW